MPGSPLGCTAFQTGQNILGHLWKCVYAYVCVCVCVWSPTLRRVSPTGRCLRCPDEGVDWSRDGHVRRQLPVLWRLQHLRATAVLWWEKLTATNTTQWKNAVHLSTHSINPPSIWSSIHPSSVYLAFFLSFSHRTLSFIITSAHLSFTLHQSISFLISLSDPFFCQSVHPFIPLSCLSVHLPVYFFIHSFIWYHLSVYKSIHPSVRAG